MMSMCKYVLKLVDLPKEMTQQYTPLKRTFPTML